MSKIVRQNTHQIWTRTKKNGYKRETECVQQECANGISIVADRTVLTWSHSEHGLNFWAVEWGRLLHALTVLDKYDFIAK